MVITSPDVGDELGWCRLVRRAIERVQAKDIPEADKRSWIAHIEAQYRSDYRSSTSSL
jgi:hypothetical protein